ncbi:Enhancer of polycomb-like protein 1 [Dipsacomyces acuminosporus]|nr:Enhancer of polycomb-like protein 1 [Dipsacomyces acuminosporus]
MVNVQRFRARKVDLRRPLPVYRAADLDDLEDDDNRQVDAIETGVEKDEEAEHHLQAAISATHAAVTGEAPAKQVYIPTPDASKVVHAYSKLYPKNFTCPTSLIRSSETVEECCAPMYCMDDQDVEWLAAVNHKRAKAELPPLTEDDCEVGLDQLESLTKDMVFLRPEDIPSIEYLASHAADRDRQFSKPVVDIVFSHWKDRRIKNDFKPTMPSLQYEDISKTEIDPYVCFRRREVRQGRKTRRADQRSLEQMRRVRVNLSLVTQLLDSCLDRERAKIEVVSESQTISQQRSNVLRMRRRLSLTSQDYDDLFTPPVQQRKRVAPRDPSQKQRGSSRKPRIASGLASAAAAAAAAAGGSGGIGGASGPGASHGGIFGEPVLPSAFVLPRTVTIHQYPTPKRLQEHSDRIRARSHAYESRLASGWVDTTFASSSMGLHATRATKPLSASFWSPRVAADPSEAHSQLPLAFRVRGGRLGRVFLDRRFVRASSVPEERLEQYRLGLLKPEDHALLRPPARQSAGTTGGIPEDLVRPFSFPVDFLTQDAQPPAPLPLSIPAPGGISGMAAGAPATAAASEQLPSIATTAAADNTPLSIIGASLPELSITPTPNSLVDKSLSPHTPVSSVGSVAATITVPSSKQNGSHGSSGSGSMSASVDSYHAIQNSPTKIASPAPLVSTTSSPVITTISQQQQVTSASSPSSMQASLPAATAIRNA